VTIDLEKLKTERDRIKDGLRELELEQRRMEAELKGLRQREVQAKRQIEALTTLIDIQEQHTKDSDGGEATDATDA
jgi:chromosome segregation ATPase